MKNVFTKNLIASAPLAVAAIAMVASVVASVVVVGSTSLTRSVMAEP